MTQNAAHELESKVLFALQHPVSQTERGTLAQLLAADSMRQVLDYWDAGERVLLAVLREGGGGPAGASQLLFLGCLAALDAGAFSGFLNEAERRVKSEGAEGGRALELVLPAPLACMRTLLTSRGYSHVYTYLTLVAEVGLTRESSDAEWRDVDVSNLDAALSRCVSRNRCARRISRGGPRGSARRGSAAEDALRRGRGRGRTASGVA